MPLKCLQDLQSIRQPYCVPGVSKCHSARHVGGVNEFIAGDREEIVSKI